MSNSGTGHRKPEALVFGLTVTLIIFQFYICPCVKGLDCIECTDETSPNCVDGLNDQTKRDLLKECKSTPTAIPIGCQVLAVQYPFPISTYFYRGCLYKGYEESKCHEDLRIENYLGKTSIENKVIPNFDLTKYVTCINSERKKMELPPLRSDDLPSEKGDMSRYLNFADKDTGTLTHINDQDPRTTNKNAKASVPRLTNITCYECNTDKDAVCDGYAASLNLPTKQCGAHSQGCYLRCEENEAGETIWMDRGCWYPGYLHCLKGRKPLARAWKHIPAPCKNSRQLIHEGNELVWVGNETYQTASEYNSYISCHDNIKAQIDAGGQPTAPPYKSRRSVREADPFPKTILYYFCTPTNKCNSIPSLNYMEPRAAQIPNSSKTNNGPSEEITEAAPPSSITPPTTDVKDEIELDGCTCYDCGRSMSRGTLATLWNGPSLKSLTFGTIFSLFAYLSI